MALHIYYPFMCVYVPFVCMNSAYERSIRINIKCCIAYFVYVLLVVLLNGEKQLLTERLVSLYFGFVVKNTENVDTPIFIGQHFCRLLLLFFFCGSPLLT